MYVVEYWLNSSNLRSRTGGLEWLLARCSSTGPLVRDPFLLPLPSPLSVDKIEFPDLELSTSVLAEDLLGKGRREL